MKTYILPLLCLLAISCGSNAFAAKEVFVRSKPHVNVGTLGSSSDLKLALSVALAEDSEPGLPGVTIYVDLNQNGLLEAFLVEIETASADYGMFDFNEQDTIDNMLYGGVEQDGSILVVSAADGPMPQTREHVLLARQVGVPAIVVFLDLDGVLDQGEVDRAEKDTRSLLSEAGYRGDIIPVVRGSASGALRGDFAARKALAELRDALDLSVNLR